MMEKVGVTLLLCIVFASAISAPNVTATVTYDHHYGFTSLPPTHSHDFVRNIRNDPLHDPFMPLCESPLFSGPFIPPTHSDDDEKREDSDDDEKREVDALLSFKNAITSDPYGALSNWTAHNAENVCSWNGISCLPDSRRVNAIKLGLLDLKGTLSPSLGNLSFLKCLDMSHNMLNGSIPEAIANLNQLQILKLESNKLSGHIPHNNNISGNIPHSIGQLKSLTWLDLGNNNISGTIPDSIGSLISLNLLIINNNNLHGLIPQGINHLVNIKELDLSNNKLNGPIPKGISNFTMLNALDVSHNSLSGDLHISFPISLNSLIVSHNSFSGDLHIDFPLNLKHFSSFSNHFYGTFPLSLANCTQLQLLDLRENNLIGELPPQLPNFYELRVLSIAYNQFHGGIPQWITHLTNLQVLDLSNNKFNGRIPSTLQHLTGFKVNISYSEDTLYYELRIDVKGSVYDLPYVLMTNTILDLSSNDLMGEIPTSMGNLSSLRLLNLSRNQLDGEIPASLGNISTLEQLDLAKNNLSGCIPQELSQLFWLAFLNVSSNNLCGPIPTGRQFSTFIETSFQRNKCLCGYLSQPCNHQKRSSPTDDNTKSNVKEGWLRHVEENVSLIALELGMGIGFGGVVAMFIVWDRARNWVVPPHRRPFFGMYRFPK